MSVSIIIIFNILQDVKHTQCTVTLVEILFIEIFVLCRQFASNHVFVMVTRANIIITRSNDLHIGCFYWKLLRHGLPVDIWHTLLPVWEQLYYWGNSSRKKHEGCKVLWWHFLDILVALKALLISAVRFLSFVIFHGRKDQTEEYRMLQYSIKNL
jgi:hypothetical protein